MKHNPKVVEAFFNSYGIPQPQAEYKFHPDRRWRFDYAWPALAEPHSENGSNSDSVALEIEGGIWTGGRHTNPSGFIKDIEKYNSAAVLGWRIIRVQPKDLLTRSTADLIRSVLCLS